MALESSVATGSGMPSSLAAEEPAQTGSMAESQVQVRLAEDVLRPQFHLLPAANWMNDPNGPIYYRGQYHVFYQYNPHAAVWGDMHWAHSVSQDMVHWRHLPVALAPTPGGPDADGCFSGSIVVDNGVPTMMYTGVASAPAADSTLRDGTHNFRETQLLATSADPMLRTWTKRPEPVIATPPKGLDVTGFRDPAPWHDGGRDGGHDGDWWYVAIGSGIRKQGGAVLLYRSRDMRAWEYLHPLATGAWDGRTTGANGKPLDPVDTGEMWECPDFFAIGDKHVLLYSTQRKVYWTVGDYDAKEMRFHAQERGLLDMGAYYAPKSMLDGAGNRILWGWVPETRPEAEFSRAGWAGCMSLPRVLTVNGANQLEMQVARGVKDLRGAVRTMPKRPKETSASTDSAVALPTSNGSPACEVHCSFAPGSKAGSLALGPAAAPYVSVRYEPAAGDLKFDPQPGDSGRTVPLKLAAGQAVDVELYMDASVVEVFVNKRFAFTKRVYTLDGANTSGAGVRYSGDAGTLRDLAVWPIAPISKNRLTG